ncbi:hypothetical protein LIT38_20265 [Bacillus sp. CMF12]|uniref:hypothetical protein n=1 Tax=Bacillus sp. CMF12 TaxID=2884834 RepID=UPI00207A0FF3|nr:hypothetical protein [Bacillus sp. CMF12]USK48847.1 hypothetical protein LIT38_20265 [Bacillus sp. CMF12]
MSKKKIARIPVCLNYADPYQSELISHIKKFTNQSAYLKSLVIRDYEATKKATAQPVINRSMSQLTGIILD